MSVVFQRLSDHHMHISLDKCVFARNEIEFLGLRLTSYGVFPQSDKVSAITIHPLPENYAALRRFLDDCVLSPFHTWLSHCTAYYLYVIIKTFC